MGREAAVYPFSSLLTPQSTGDPSSSQSDPDRSPLEGQSQAQTVSSAGPDAANVCLGRRRTAGQETQVEKLSTQNQSVHNDLPAKFSETQIFLVAKIQTDYLISVISQGQLMISKWSSDGREKLKPDTGADLIVHLGPIFVRMITVKL